MVRNENFRSWFGLNLLTSLVIQYFDNIFSTGYCVRIKLRYSNACDFQSISNPEVPQTTDNAERFDGFI